MCSLFCAASLAFAQVVETARGQALADEYGMKFFETSAKSDINVTEAFMSLARDVVRRLGSSNPPQPQQPRPSIAITPSPEVQEACPFCKKSFSLFFRKQHCRACGASCCGSCSRQRAEVTKGSNKKVEHSCWAPLRTPLTQHCATLHAQISQMHDMRQLRI